jgi:hypothetical protein
MKKKSVPPSIAARPGHPASLCRAVSFLIALSIVTFNVNPAYSAGGDRSPAVVTKVHFAVSGLRVTVSYDLQGDPSATYDVSVVLRSRSDPAFGYEPKALSGDIGVGKYAGPGKEIVWDMGKEFPQGMHGSGYYFVVDARRVSAGNSTGILTWLGAGAVAVAAVITFAIVTRNGGPTSPASYPNPPGRP